MDNTGKYDVIIAGSGPGGATLAKELSMKGKKVLVLEWGSGRLPRGSFLQYLLWQLVPGRSLLFTNGLLGIVRGIVAGGSSMFYYGTCFPVPLRMLEKYGIDLSAEAEEAGRELPVAPLRDDMITPMAAAIMKSARRLGYKWEKLDKFMYQDRWKPGQMFGYYGDPDGVKWSARTYLDQAVEQGAELVTGAKVKRVLFEDRKAVGVEYSCRGIKRRVFADKVILAAGGTGTPVILRKSGIRGVGKDFFFDPLISVCGTVKDISVRQDEIPMSAGCNFEEDGYMMTDMALPKPLDSVFAAEVLRFHRMFSHRHVMRIMVKAKDGLGGAYNGRGRSKEKADCGRQEEAPSRRRTGSRNPGERRREGNI